MILYQYPGGDGVSSISSPCLKVAMALKLVGVEFETKSLISQNDAAKISSTGRLPVLEIDGERIVDSVSILDRLERDFPQAGLAPEDPQERVRDRLWEHFATDSMYWSGFYLRWVHPGTRDHFFDTLLARRPAILRWLARRLVLPRQVRRSVMHGSGGKTPAAVEADLDRGLDMIEIGLCGGPFLQGRDRPGRGDIALTSLLVQAGWRDTLTEMRDNLLARPALIEHGARVLDACGMKRVRWMD